MELIPWSEIHPLAALNSEIDSIFDQFFDWPAVRALEPWGDFLRGPLAVDMEETDKEIVVKAEIPGLEPDDFQISVDDHTLTIKGEKKREKTEKKKDYHMIERHYGSFYRSIPLPSDVVGNKAKADYSKGVLEITLTKSHPHKAKKITVNVK